jgi:hypothetical protein
MGLFGVRVTNHIHTNQKEDTKENHRENTQNTESDDGMAKYEQDISK